MKQTSYFYFEKLLSGSSAQCTTSKNSSNNFVPYLVYSLPDHTTEQPSSQTCPDGRQMQTIASPALFRQQHHRALVLLVSGLMVVATTRIVVSWSVPLHCSIHSHYSKLLYFFSGLRFFCMMPYMVTSPVVFSKNHTYLMFSVAVFLWHSICNQLFVNLIFQN